MNPDYWGTQTWHYLHSLSFTYPEKPTLREKLQHKRFFEHLLLPCYGCQQNYNQHIKDLPVSDYLNSKLELAYWMYLMHSAVNARLKKPNPTFKEVTQRYLPKVT